MSRQEKGVIMQRRIYVLVSVFLLLVATSATASWKGDSARTLKSHAEQAKRQVDKTIERLPSEDNQPKSVVAALRRVAEASRSMVDAADNLIECADYVITSEDSVTKEMWDRLMTAATEMVSAYREWNEACDDARHELIIAKKRS
jgi:hypothetical protein